MANPEHVGILKSGVEEWNAWRRENPSVRPEYKNANFRDVDLRGVNFKHAKFIGTDFSGADLRGANLEDADLKEAKFWGADLSGASLSEANLTNANLSHTRCTNTNFSYGNLAGIDLGGAKLGSTNLTYSMLSGAKLENSSLFFCLMQASECINSNFNGAQFGYNVIVRSDLTKCVGLEHCCHLSPSSIDCQTAAKSGGLPDVFLKGCGWQDWEIESAKLFNADLRAEDIAEITNNIYHLRHETTLEIPKLFISYSHADREFVEQLEQRLEAARIRYWRDVHHATAGPLDKIISHAIDSSGSVLLILSDKSIESTWVKFEIDKANSRYFRSDIPVLCPIALDDSWKEGRWPENLMRTLIEFNILDFSRWNEGAAQQDILFKKLIDGLKLFYSRAKDAKRKGGE